MSLRLRMLLVAALSVAALLVTVLALTTVVRDTRAASIAGAAIDSEAAALALARAARTLPPGALEDTPDGRTAMRAHAAAILAPLLDTRGGYCFRDGRFVEAESSSLRDGRPQGPPGDGPHGGPPGAPPRDAPSGAPLRDAPPRDAPPRDAPPPAGTVVPHSDADGPPGPPPDVRAALVEACKKATWDRAERRDVTMRGHTTVLLVVGADDRLAAFAMRIVSGPDQSRGPVWWVVLGGLPVLTLLIVAVTIETILTLRRGVRDLGGTLSTLERDLRAGVPEQSTRELAQISEQVHAFAVRLADAHDRERSLEREVGHQRRLGSLGRLVAGVAHEIRNPLTGIKLLLDGMKRRELDARTARDVQTCLGEISRLNEIVTVFLGVARDAREPPVTFEAADLVDERIAAAVAHAEPRGVKVARRGAAKVFAERNVIVQIVDNLLRNAIDASPDGAEVEVVIAGDTTGARVDVIDAGEGVPPAIADSLFEPFVTSKARGTGLGLWLSHTAATSRGGDLRYHRDAGRTHFALTIPGKPS